jgi:hypothetical protein
MSRYLLRRLLIAVPSVHDISASERPARGGGLVIYLFRESLKQLVGPELVPSF